MDTNLFSTIKDTDLYRKMWRVGALVALICLTATAMAQTNEASTWSYVERFPKLPPLTVDFDIALFAHPRPNLLLMPLGSVQNKETMTPQSIMYRHVENQTMPHFHFKSGPNIQTGDGLKGVRDRIVRERRRKEGHPLQPLPPGIRR